MFVVLEILFHIFKEKKKQKLEKIKKLTEKNSKRNTFDAFITIKKRRFFNFSFRSIWEAGRTLIWRGILKKKEIYGELKINTIFLKILFRQNF